MCNRFKHDTNRLPEKSVFGVERIFDPDAYVFDGEGNGAPVDVYPDRLAPVIRAADGGGYESVDMRWGFPAPPNVAGGRPVTNVRNTASGYWKPWLKPERRCLVPFATFAEWSDARPKRERWFAPTTGRPTFFAGIWRPWTGTRGTKAAPVEGEHLLFSFLTCEPNAIVAPVHAKAMPVLVTNPDDAEIWLHAPVDVALTLQRPAPGGALELLAAYPAVAR